MGLCPRNLFHLKKKKSAKSCCIYSVTKQQVLCEFTSEKHKYIIKCQKEILTEFIIMYVGMKLA